MLNSRRFKWEIPLILLLPLLLFLVAFLQASHLGSEETYCNQEYCINAAVGTFQYCERKTYTMDIFRNREPIGYYSSSPETLEKCKEIWKFIEDSKKNQTEAKQ